MGLLAELTAIRWKLMTRGIQIESKDDIKKRLGRSTDKADAVIMAWSEGQRLAERHARRKGRGKFRVNLAYAKTKRHGREARRHG